jgi:hypothetical protein
MRPPRIGKGKSAPPEAPGGRAWKRVQQFNLARGLPTASAPTATAELPLPPVDATAKSASTPRIGAKKPSTATKSGPTAERSTRARRK